MHSRLRALRLLLALALSLAAQPAAAHPTHSADHAAATAAWLPAAAASVAVLVAAVLLAMLCAAKKPPPEPAHPPAVTTAPSPAVVASPSVSSARPQLPLPVGADKPTTASASSSSYPSPPPPTTAPASYIDNALSSPPAPIGSSNASPTSTLQPQATLRQRPPPPDPAAARPAPPRAPASLPHPAVDPAAPRPQPLGDPAAPQLPARSGTVAPSIGRRQPAQDPLLAGDMVGAPSQAPPVPMRSTIRKPPAPLPPPTANGAYIGNDAHNGDVGDEDNDFEAPPPIPTRASLQNSTSGGSSAPEPPARPPRVGDMLISLPDELPRATGTGTAAAASSPKMLTLTSSKIQLPDTHGDFERRQLDRGLLTTQEPALGTGFFGSVYRGTYRGQSVQDVAVKTLHKEDLEERDARMFLLEAQIMMEFNNPNVLFLIGVLTNGEPWCIVTELCELGDLRKLLKKSVERNLKMSAAENVRVLAQIAAGMNYLADRQFIHRDLAARNCLVTKEGTVKIGDFGMSRLVLTEEDYYFAQEEDALPIRWMAVESMHHFRFSLRTDVWSFGVVCFEVFSQAGTPYGDLTPMVLPFKVKEGVRPAQPEGCSSDMYRLMQSCWDASPARRPSFRTIYAKLAELHQVELTQAGVPVRDLGHVLRFIAYGNQSELDTDPYMLEATLARQNASHSDDAGDASSGYSQLTGVHKTYIKASLLALPPLPAAETDTDGMGNLEYFHGAISRQAAERLLMSQGRVAELEGCFLVRNGSSPGDLVLSVVFEGKVRHYRIQQLEDGRYRFYGRDYETVDDLVAEHRTVKNKLMAVLRNHCPREAT